MATSTTAAKTESATSAERLRTLAVTFGLSAVSWGLFGLALDPINLWWLSFFAYVPLFLAARRAGQAGDGGWPSAAGATLGALPFWLFQQRWIADISAAGFVPFAVYLSAYSGLFVWITGSARRRFPRVPWWFSAIIVWVGLETLRADLVFDGYPWYLAAQPLIESSWASALGAWVGLSGVSAVIVSISATSAHAIAGSWKPAALTVAVAATLLGAAAASRPAGNGTPLVTIAAVQTNVPQSNKLRSSTEDLVRQHADLMDLTRIAAQANPDVIVWPETMRPGQAFTPEQRLVADEAGVGHVWDSPSGRVFLPDTRFAVELLELNRELGIPMLVGEDYAENLRFTRRDDGRIEVGYDARFNSVFMVDRGEVLPGRYDKLFRTPFGETMPWIRAFPAIESKLLALAAGGLKLDLAAGQGPVAFTLSSGTRLATPICFEVTVPSVCRQLVVGPDGRRRADMLVNVTNDGWFGPNAVGKSHHAQLARWRCVELAVPLVRAANSGISSAADSRGVPLGGRQWTSASGWTEVPVLKLASNTAGVVVCTVPRPGEPTLYGRTGNLLGPAGVGGLSALVLILLWSRFSKR